MKCSLCENYTNPKLATKKETSILTFLFVFNYEPEPTVTFQEDEDFAEPESLEDLFGLVWTFPLLISSIN